MSNVMEVLKERGFIKQVSHEAVSNFLGNNKVSFYVGFDPTADSLHIGHYVPLMAMAHMQKAGHKPIVLLGGGTAVVGDPSGRSDMRSMMTMDTIHENVESFRKQISRFLDFSPGGAIMVDNADWLLNLNYVEFIREIGVHFSVNRMLTADCFKSRMEKGLSFLEFNYMLMQGYDFLELYRRYGCRLQMGGDDQWSNILAGADLIRRKEGVEAYAMTCKLLLKSDGTKMGKTAGGAVWLDENKTPVFDFYQYWRNVDDADVGNCLSLMTFLPMDEVKRLSSLRDAEINEAKKVLAFEVTKLVHGEQKAAEARQAAEALFGSGGAMDNVPKTVVDKAALKDNPRVVDVMALCGLAKSKGDARRLIQGGGVYVNDDKITDPDAEILPYMENGEAMLRKGKKTFHQIVAG